MAGNPGSEAYQRLQSTLVNVGSYSNSLDLLVQGYGPAEGEEVEPEAPAE